MTVGQTLRTWSATVTIMSVAALLLTLLADAGWRILHHS